MITKIIFLLFLFAFAKGNLSAQIMADFTCGTTSTEVKKDLLDPHLGMMKPLRTDLSGPNPSISSAYFPVLIIFVQFQKDINTPEWPQDEAPVYLDSLISPIKRTNSSWWNAYNENTETISDYWMETSRGKFHVAGDAYSILLDNEASYYAAFDLDNTKDTAENMINEEVWAKLNSASIDWTKYDRWTDSTDGYFYYKPDKKVDMIYMIHKTTGGIFPNKFGYSHLAANTLVQSYQVSTEDTISVYYNWNMDGSGLTLNKSTKKTDILGIIAHEHGHYLYANGHITYGKVSYGVGLDFYFSPYEMIYMGYMAPTVTNFGQTYELPDYSTRDNGDGNILQVPISGTDEFFLLCNRTKTSRYDRVMLGDTAQYDIFNTLDYGKGLYIYHVPNGIHGAFGDADIAQDMECADGYWSWNMEGYSSVNINCHTISGFPYFKKSFPLYTNDNSLLNVQGTPVGDGLSLHYRYSSTPQGEPISTPNRFAYGKPAANNCVVGTDRMFTNDNELYSNFEHMGDRWDPWNVGYNEVFSPYSSPSTCKWNNQASDIFIWYKGNEGGNAIISVYKAGSGGYSLDSILKITPPSKPVGLTTEHYYPEDTSICHPLIYWPHNKEPDMYSDFYAKYIIYRAVKSDMNDVPTNYVKFDSVVFFSETVPYYIDYSVNLYDCPIYDQPPYGDPYPVRYKVQAVDASPSNDLRYSLLSDFVSFVGVTENGKESDNRPAVLSETEVVKFYRLNQNYPNPFNPITNIQYDLPKDNFVRIKVYDILGKEMAIIVNEFKTAGSYLISFDGSKLASGIYFYKIETKDFVQTKRMILLK